MTARSHLLPPRSDAVVGSEWHSYDVQALFIAMANRFHNLLIKKYCSIAIEHAAAHFDDHGKGSVEKEWEG